MQKINHEAIKRIRKHIAIYKYKELHAAYIVEALERAISALQAQEESRWIPMTEKLPEEAEDILICDIDGDIYLGHRSRCGEYYADFCSDRIKNVIAWMPRPKPYKEDKP